MSKTMGRPRGISQKRMLRITEEIAPLVARGLTYTEISNLLGISRVQVTRDCEYLCEHWQKKNSERMENARWELVAKHDEIYKTAFMAYEETKSQQRGGNPKFLEMASKELECLGRLLGQAGPNINLHSHQHVHGVDPASVAELFKPLEPSDYAAMVAARQLPEPEQATELPVVAAAETVDADAVDWVADPVGVDDATPDSSAAKPKNRYLDRPLR